MKNHKAENHLMHALSIILAICFALVGGWGAIGTAFFTLLACYLFEAQYRLGRQTGNAEGRDRALREVEEEEARRLAEARATELALWNAVAESIRASQKRQTMMIRNPNYGEKN